MEEIKKTSRHSFIVTLLLCIFLGWLGVHRFYAGRMITGLFMFCTLGFFGIGTLFDFFIIIAGLFRDGDGLRIKP